LEKEAAMADNTITQEQAGGLRPFRKIAEADIARLVLSLLLEEMLARELAVYRTPPGEVQGDNTEGGGPVQAVQPDTPRT
jgi:hypothetical protein